VCLDTERDTVPSSSGVGKLSEECQIHDMGGGLWDLLVQLEERLAFQLTRGSSVIIRSAVMAVDTKLLPVGEGRQFLRAL
jgi:hypothetical protein